MDIDIPSSLVNAKVVDLLDDEGSWNLKILEDWLPNVLLQKMLVITPPDGVNDEDTRMWPDG
jgi:hypothetical protein